MDGLNTEQTKTVAEKLVRESVGFFLRGACCSVVVMSVVSGAYKLVMMMFLLFLAMNMITNAIMLSSFTISSSSRSSHVDVDHFHVHAHVHAHVQAAHGHNGVKGHENTNAVNVHVYRHLYMSTAVRA